jgi:hypothetical protein
MRAKMLSWIVAGLCGLGAYGVLAVPAARAEARADAHQANLDQANAANDLAVKIRTAINPERCPTAEEALAAIQAATVGEHIQTIATALKIVEADPWWCEAVRTALSAADEAAQLALASGIGSTGGVPAGGGTVVVFSGGSIGAPGGGGGSGYH